jgi:predicted transcriptional regulator
MKVVDLVNELDLIVYSGEKGLENEITGGYVSDLLSDVMGNSKSGEIWITLQTHKNVAAIASLKELSAVVLVNNHKPDQDTIEHCDEECIPVLGTSLPTYDIAGRIYNLLNC